MKAIVHIGLVIFLTSLDCPADQPQPKSSKAVVLVRVNGHEITQSDFDHFVRTRKLTAEDATERRELLIQRLIERQLLRQFLNKHKVAADPKLLDEHLTRLRLQIKQRGDDFEKTLIKLGLTEATLRRELSLPLDWETYVRLQMTDAKLREIWNARQHEFDGTEVRAAHIVLKSDQPDADEKRLVTLREDLVTRKLTFGEAAKKISQSPSADDGGDLGRFGFRGRQPPPFPQVAFGLKVGEISPPFRSPFGVHLLTVTERIAGQFSLEDARPDIFATQSAEMQRDTLTAEKAKAEIEVQ